MYIIYMNKKLSYPAWAEKYRGKGRTIRKVGDGYGLYECTSHYVKGQKYPKSVQKYLGMISEEEGFIPKHVTPLNPKYIEYGLSHFILVNFKRDLMRSTYHGNYDLVVLGIVQYLFDSLDPVCLEASAVSYATSQHLKDLIDQGIGTTRITSVANKINSLLKVRIPEEKERNLVIKLLYLCVKEKSAAEESVSYPEEIVEIIKRSGLKL